jgi:hypothetical protein
MNRPYPLICLGILIGLTFANITFSAFQLTSQFVKNEDHTGLVDPPVDRPVPRLDRPVPRQIIPRGTNETKELKNSAKRKGTNRAAMCCVAKDEEAYIDEWVDYHHALGFDSIQIYDNSDGFELKQWGEEKGHHVTVTHYPGIAKQSNAYLDCARRLAEGGNHTWAAFFDVDEFLILKKHAHVEDFLLEKCSSGTLTVNWLMFSGSDRTLYSPAPVTKRFMHREENTNIHIKSIVRLRDMNFKGKPTPHHPRLINPADQKDTNGKRVTGSFNRDGPTDVAVLHHYHSKSLKEYDAKVSRGRATKNPPRDRVSPPSNTFFDDAAWKAMKKYVPEYATFDALSSLSSRVNEQTVDQITSPIQEAVDFVD